MRRTRPNGAPARGAVRAGAPSSFWYARPAATVARDLIGGMLVSTVDGVETAGRIVETEAYIGPHDDASHAAERIGRTARNATMFAAPGIAYVYRIYGIHWCLNVVTDAIDFPAAVLVRAIEPLRGIEHMRARRSAGQKRLPDRALASGPGKLAAAFGITGRLDGHALDRAPLWIERGVAVGDECVSAGPRIGITRAVDWPLRFCERGSAWLSRAP
ncbi:MAG: DNA-3-methyladenine glycosylase [Gemmatimonadota bacterium]